MGGAALAEPGLVAGVIKRMIGRSSKEAGVVKHARRCAVTLRSRKAHEARRRHSILGYDSDDEVDETDGGFRVYEGSRLSLEVKSNTREGKMHILPEELLALCLVELRGRAIKAREQSADPVPRAVTMVTPACWGDAQRPPPQPPQARRRRRAPHDPSPPRRPAPRGRGRAAVLSETIHGGGGGGKNGAVRPGGHGAGLHGRRGGGAGGAHLRVQPARADGGVRRTRGGGGARARLPAREPEK